MIDSMYCRHWLPGMDIYEKKVYMKHYIVISYIL
jgi:hypothetical protein